MKRKFPIWLTVAAVILCVCIAGVLFWQPITTALAPEVTLAAAVANTASQVAQRLTSPLTDCVSQAYSYWKNGTVDATFTLDNILADTSYRLTTAVDPEDQRQASSYHITVVGLSTDIYTYLDADCAAFSMNLLSGDDYYGITFDTYASDLNNAEFYDRLSPDTVSALEEVISGLDAVYGPSDTRSDNLALPEIEAPDWTRTLLAYLDDLEFEGSQVNYTLDGVSTECSAIRTQMSGRYAAQMFLDALETVSANVFLASSLYSGDEAVDTPQLQELLEYYRDQTEGAVTLTAYIYGGALVAADLEWKFSENFGSTEINDTEVLTLNLGANPAESQWLLTLQQARGTAVTSTGYTFSYSGSNYYLTEQRTENGTVCQTDLILEWNDQSSVLNIQLTNASGTAAATGTLASGETGVLLEIGGLYDLLTLSGLDLLQELDLGLVKDITVEAAFSPEVNITKPEYVNLDKWEIPFLLDLFL